MVDTQTKGATASGVTKPPLFWPDYYKTKRAVASCVIKPLQLF